MNAFFKPTDAEMSAELDALLAAPCTVKAEPLTAAQKRRIEAISLKAMKCDGDTVSTINYLLDGAIASLADLALDDKILTALNAVRHYHLPILTDAYEVDTSRAH